MTTTGARPARWSVKCSTMMPETGWRTTSIGHVSKGVKEPVLSRVFEYWRNIDPDLGKAIEEGVRGKQ